MKSIHFCTKELLEKLEDPKCSFLESFRTGWIRQYKIGNIIKIYEQINQNGIKVLIPKGYGKVHDYRPIQYKNIPSYGLDEVKRYNKKFHKDDWFFRIIIEKRL